MIGKTGSGKTTVAALVAMACAASGARVVAVDTDVTPNLGLSLGAGGGTVAAARTVPRALVRGRAGGGVSADQFVRGYATATPSGVALLHAMHAGEEPGGCGCPAHASARSVLASALEEAFDVAVVDMEAGLDHLDRPDGTLAHTDALLVVLDPSRKSVVSGQRMVERAAAGGIAPLAVVGNKASLDGGDEAVFAAAAAEHGVPLAGVVPHSRAVVDADRAGAGLQAASAELGPAVAAILAWFLPAG